MKAADLVFEKKIGKGNFGEVWKGSYKNLEVAIKKLYFVDDELMKTYINREMATLRGVHHPNIVQLVGICDDDKENVFIVTEFVDGGNLNQLIQSYRAQRMNMAWSQRLKIALATAKAMRYLHDKKNIMHRDLKSDNILIGKDGTIKLCDFGLARQEANENRLFTSVGTDQWTAPEVLLQSTYNKSADVFSFGIILWELLTLTGPPKRSVRHKWAFVAESNEWLVPIEAPTGMWELLCECCITDPEQRPTFSVVKEKLHEVLNEARVKEGKQPIPTVRKKGEVLDRRGSEGERLRKLLVFHIKDSTESPIDFFNLGKTPGEDGKEKEEEKPPPKEKRGLKIKTLLLPSLSEGNLKEDDENEDNPALHKHMGKTIGLAKSQEKLRKEKTREKSKSLLGPRPKDEKKEERKGGSNREDRSKEKEKKKESKKDLSTLEAKRAELEQRKAELQRMKDLKNLNSNRIVRDKLN